MSTTKIIQKQKEVCGIIIEMNQNSGAVQDVDYSIKGSKSFDYKTIIKERLEGNNTEKEVTIVVPLKHLSNFWKTLDTVK